MKKIAVIGVGNPLRQDDGIGILLLKKLKKIEKNLPKSIDLIDFGTGGMNLLYVFEKYQRIIIIDAADINKKPGEVLIFNPNQVISKKINSKITTHQSDILNIVEIAKKLGTEPYIKFFAVQPQITDCGTELSKKLQKNLDMIFKKLIEEINKTTQMEQ